MIYEATCLKCGDTFNPDGPDDLVHVVRTSDDEHQGDECGGQGVMLGTWDQRSAPSPAARRLLAAYDNDSTASIDLEAANPFELFGQLASHPKIRAEVVAPAIAHGWPTYRYSGPITALAYWLSEAYDDGSGEPWWELLARHLYPQGVPVSPAQVLADYERTARRNRPDWLAFIDDANDDPAGICYEIAEHAGTMGAALTLDQAFEIGQEWVRGLVTQCPRCSGPVVAGQSLSGLLDPDGVVHECPAGPWCDEYDRAHPFGLVKS